jgi:hypothetical protein
MAHNIKYIILSSIFNFHPRGYIVINVVSMINVVVAINVINIFTFFLFFAQKWFSNRLFGRKYHIDNSFWTNDRFLCIAFRIMNILSSTFCRNENHLAHVKFFPKSSSIILYSISLLFFYYLHFIFDFVLVASIINTYKFIFCLHTRR